MEEGEYGLDQEWRHSRVVWTNDGACIEAKFNRELRVDGKKATNASSDRVASPRNWVL